MQRTSISLWIALLAAPLGANTLTVGPPGTGAAFTDIQGAIAAAQPGDTLLVAPGSYDPFAVDKPLRILGAGSGTTLVAVPPAVPESSVVTIDGIPLGGEVLLSGLELRGTSGSCWSLFGPPCEPWLEITNCAGSIVLHDLLIDQPSLGLAIPSGPGIEVRSTSRAILLSTVVNGLYGRPMPALVAEDSGVWLIDSELRGGSGIHDITPTYSAPGVELVNAVLYLARTQVYGGDGGTMPAFGLPWGAAYSGSAAITAEASTLKLVAGPGSILRGGTAGTWSTAGCATGGAGLVLSSSSAALVSSSLLVEGGSGSAGACPPNPAPAIVADASSDVFHVAGIYPTLATSAASALIGGTFHLELDGNPGSAAVAYTSLATGPNLFLAGIDGALALDPAGLRLLGAVLLDGAGSAQLPLAVPAKPALVGATVYFQVLEVAAAQSALSNPVVVTVIG